MKLCLDCKHCETTWGNWCRYPWENPVDGTPLSEDERRDCYVVRISGPCGYDGKYHELAIPTDPV